MCNECADATYGVRATSGSVDFIDDQKGRLITTNF